MYSKPLHSFAPVGLTGILPGLYVVSRPKAGGLVTHVGILDWGNRRSAQPEWFPTTAVVIHLGPEGLLVEEFASGGWVLGGQILQEAAAVERLRGSLSGKYDLFSNNCEHFVDYIARGVDVPVSPQLKAAAAVVLGLVGVTLVAKAMRA